MDEQETTLIFMQEFNIGKARKFNIELHEKILKVALHSLHKTILKHTNYNSESMAGQSFGFQ